MGFLEGGGVPSFGFLGVPESELWGISVACRVFEFDAAVVAAYLGLCRVFEMAGFAAGGVTFGARFLVLGFRLRRLGVWAVWGFCAQGILQTPGLLAGRMRHWILKRKRIQKLQAPRADRQKTPLAHA